MKIAYYHTIVVKSCPANISVYIFFLPHIKCRETKWDVCMAAESTHLASHPILSLKIKVKRYIMNNVSVNTKPKMHGTWAWATHRSISRISYFRTYFSFTWKLLFVNFLSPFQNRLVSALAPVSKWVSFLDRFLFFNITGSQQECSISLSTKCG